MEPDYLERLASASPTPGGGSAATIVAAMGAALVAMAARIIAANRTYSSKHEIAHRIAERADALRLSLLAARNRDETAFAAVMQSEGDERQNALREAAAAPLAVMHDALAVERLALDAFEFGNSHLESDLICAAEFAAAALRACALNVRINHRWMKDAPLVASQQDEAENYERESARILTAIRAKE